MKDRLDGNEMEESRDRDTRRYQQQDNNGHLHSSNLANSNEQNTEELREAENKSEYNKLDKRGNPTGTDQAHI